MALVVIVVAYWIGMYTLLVCGVPLARALLEFLGLALVAVCRLIGQAGTILIPGIYRLTIRAAVLTGRGVCQAATFLFYLADELVRGGKAEAEEEPELEFEWNWGDSEEEAPEDDESLVEAALCLLGLSRNFTREALETAYKRAIRSAHPDAGGEVDQAQAVNAARDLLRRSKGWT